MGLLRAVGGFVTPVALSGVTTVTTTDPDTATAFPPVAVILFSTGLFVGADTPTSSNAGTGRPAFGFLTASATQLAAAAMVRDNVATSLAAGTARADACFAGVNSTGAGGGTGLFTGALTSTGFTITCTDATAGLGMRVGYLALGGDIQAETAHPSCHTGSGSEALGTFSFLPDCLLFLDGYATTNTVNTGAGWTLGVAAGASQQWTLSGASRDAQAATVSERYLRSGECYASIQTDSPFAVKYRLALTSLDSGGFTVNRLAMPNDNALPVLALKGVSVKAGTFTLNNSGASLSGFGFSPKALLMATHGTTENAAGTKGSEHMVSVGVAASASSRVTHYMRDVNTADPTNVLTALRNDAILATSTNSSTYTTDALVDVASFDSGGFTYAVDDTSSTLFEVGYLAIGDGIPRTARSFVAGMLG